jgi:serine phosphatase RsbU (regulator of sigma subunit)
VINYLENYGKDGATIKRLDGKEELVLSYKDYAFNIYFSALEYTNPSKNRFAYMIEGITDQWIDIGARRFVAFSNLREGNYIFRVKAANNDGVWNETGAEIKIIITPPWYRTMIAWILYVVFFIVFIFLFIRLRERKLIAERENLEHKVQERTAEIQQQKEEIEAQRDEIELHKIHIEKHRDLLIVQNKQITDSIQYAKRIQTAVLPSSKIIEEYLPDNFIFFKPRDIVSGDFYFIKKVDSTLIMAAIDCTGHGVPGAFMSMLGMTLLNEIVSRKEITRPNQALEELRKHVKEALKQTGEDNEQKDGMDLAFCAIELSTNMLQFAGAHNPVWIFHEKILIELPADHMPIGIYQKERPFTNQQLQLYKGDIIYLFTDGFMSQFGGPKDEKFKTHRFRKLLTNIHTLPMDKQKDILEKKFDEWKGSLNQIDDVLVIGIQIN